MGVAKERADEGSAWERCDADDADDADDGSADGWGGVGEKESCRRRRQRERQCGTVAKPNRSKAGRRADKQTSSQRRCCSRLAGIRAPKRAADRGGERSELRSGIGRESWPQRPRECQPPAKIGCPHAKMGPNLHCTPRAIGRGNRQIARSRPIEQARQRSLFFLFRFGRRWPGSDL